jgi:thiol:disulfide interchange protein DsbD
MQRPILFLVFSILAFAGPVFGQNPVKWSLSADPGNTSVRAGREFVSTLKADIDNGWHLYALDQPQGGPVPTTIKISEGRPFVMSGTVRSPEAIVKFDPNFQIDTKYFQDTVSFGLPVKANVDTGLDALAFDVRFQLCNDTFCLPPKTVRVSLAGTEEVKRASAASPQTVAGPETAPPLSGGAIPGSTSLWGFIWLALTLGALSLLTPCVFPMIPITVSYFTNHSAGDRTKALRLASVYSLGIIATFTLLGMLLAIFVGAAGINLFAANPWINLLITAVFLLFAFNLFGAYEITIPTGVLTKLDGLTRSKEGEGSGVVGALLMGLTFTLTSFTCTSPFVGTILVSASQGNWKMPLLGMLAFSTVFALPFFVLALVPQLISQLPRAGGWMNSVKVTMGFLEVAAAMKFLSNVDLIWKWGIFTRSAVLAIWIAIGVVLSLYLLGKFQLSHDSKPERIGVVRLISAVLSLAISFYLVTGLFGAKLGEIESFLPPELENTGLKLFGDRENEPKWITNDYDAAIQRAKSENKRVFVDFTGYTCTNCRWMEANVFPKPEVETELRKFILLRLYTDGEGAVFERHQQMEQDMFGTVALPYYAVLDGTGRSLSSFPGLTRNTQEFVDFLKKSQEN